MSLVFELSVAWVGGNSAAAPDAEALAVGRA